MIVQRWIRGFWVWILCCFMAIGISPIVKAEEESLEKHKETFSLLQEVRERNGKPQFIQDENLQQIAEEKLSKWIESGWMEKEDGVLSFSGESVDHLKELLKVETILQQERLVIGSSIQEFQGKIYVVLVVNLEAPMEEPRNLGENNLSDAPEINIDESKEEPMEKEKEEEKEKAEDKKVEPVSTIVFRSTPASNHNNSIMNPEGNPLLVRGTMSGIDISSWQEGIDLTKVPGDFVIIKATQGVGYINPEMHRTYLQAKQAGKLIGFYHYASGGGAEAEARHFLATVKPYLGEGILVLDWEIDQNLAWKEGVPYAKKFLDYIKLNSGVTPLIYMSKSVTREYNWANIAGNYGLWVAQYANMKPTGYQGDPWTDTGGYGAWRGPKIHQYSSTGRLQGYAGDLDLNKAFMDRTEWKFWSAIGSKMLGYESGWKKVDGIWYYLDQEGNLLNGWQKVNGKWYYLGAEGKMQTGWQKINEKWYYLESNGEMAVGWKPLPDGTYYLDNPSGDMKIGWQNIGNHWYYFLESGRMTRGWRHHGENTYYLTEEGKMLVGWHKINNKQFYFQENGVQAKGWSKIDGTWFYFHSDGVLALEWQKVNGKWYYLGADGRMKTGWQKVNGKWYYLESNGAMATGWKPLPDGTYYLDNPSGDMKIGWHKIENKWHYFLESGRMTKGWRYHGENTYYLKEDGSMTVGWILLNGKWYYFNEGGLLQRGWITYNQKRYYLNASGVMVTGKVNINGRYYHFTDSGSLIY